MPSQAIMKSGMAVVLMKLETVYGTNPTLTEADNAIVIREFKFDFDFEEIKKSRLRGVYASAGDAIGRVLETFEFSVPLVGAGVDPLASDLDPADYEPCLLAASMQREDTGTPVTSIAYRPHSHSTESLTLEVYLFQDDGVPDLYEINGAKLSAVFSMNKGEENMIKFTGSGLFKEPAPGVIDLSLLAYLNAFDDTVPKNMTMTIGGVTRCINKFEVGPLFEVNHRECFDATRQGVSGIYHQRPVGDSLEGSWNPEMRLESVYDHVEFVISETKGALVVQVDSPTGDRIAITAPALQQSSFTHEDDEGLWRLNQAIKFVDGTSAGDDQIVLTYSRTP